MSFYAPYVQKAIRDRLVGDSGSGGLTTYLTSPYVFLDYAPVGTQPPYIVLEWTAATPNEGYTLRRHNIFIDLHIFIPAEPSDASAPQAVEANILNRVHGNWDEDITNRVPTYGLDRWLMTLGGGAWTATEMSILNTNKVPQGDEGFIQWTLNLQVDVQKGLSAS